MDELYKLKDMLCKELEEYGKKGELTAGSLEIIDKLAHAIKNLHKIIEAYEEDEGEYSGRGGSYGYDYRSYDDGGYTRGGNQGGGQGGGRYYARGRGRNAKRDSMGRYSRAESEVSGMVEELREMMDSLPAEKQREVQKFISKMEQM